MADNLGQSEVFVVDILITTNLYLQSICLQIVLKARRLFSFYLTAGSLYVNNVFQSEPDRSRPW